VRTAHPHECRTGPGQLYTYPPFVPSRRYECERYCQGRAAGVTDAIGFVPPIDDEYPEWVDMLASVLRTRDDYVVVELGARYGTWGVRALAAFHQLRGRSARAKFVGVEAWNWYYTWMVNHVAVNGRPHLP